MESLVKSNRPWLAPLIAFLSALLLFSLNLDRPPYPDELHHVLAAQHLLETGRPLLAEGEYWRGILYTWAVAISYKVFGEGLASARIPSVLLVAFVAPILFAWVRREAGFVAALLTAVLFLSSPLTVEIAQFSRFYSLQMFSFLLGTLCFYYAVAGTLPALRRIILGVLAAALLVLAISAQLTSLFGILGAMSWALGIVVIRVFFAPETSQTVKRVVATILIAAGVAIVMAATLTDVIQLGWERFRETPLFDADTRNDFWFYHVRFLLFYPTLWSLIAPLSLLAVIRNPKLGWFAVSIFSISFVLASLGGMKADRYLSFAVPFLAILWGVGLAHLVPPLWRYTKATTARFVETLALPRQSASIIGVALVVVAASTLALTNAFWLRTAAVIGNVSLPLDTPNTDWRAAREALAPWTKDADIMITTEELGAIYFLGRSDVRFSPSKLGELAPDQRVEFGIDFRTGRPVISKPESVERLIECFPRGFIVGPAEGWGNPVLINQAIQALLFKYAKPIEVPKASHLYAWGWTHEPTQPMPGYCADLRRFSGRKTQ